MGTPSSPIASLRQQLATQQNFPAGHVIAIAYAHVFGPKMKSTPEGHPIQISSGAFDNTVQTAVQAIAQAAAKWAGYVPHEANWRLDMVEDIVNHPGRPVIPYTKLYYFTYLPEQPMWQHKGIVGKVINHFQNSHYVGKNWKQHGYKIDPTHATTLIPSTEAQGASAANSMAPTPTEAPASVPAPSVASGTNTTVKA